MASTHQSSTAPDRMQVKPSVTCLRSSNSTPASRAIHSMPRYSLIKPTRLHNPLPRKRQHRQRSRFPIKASRLLPFLLKSTCLLIHKAPHSLIKIPPVRVFIRDERMEGRQDEQELVNRSQLLDIRLKECFPWWLGEVLDINGDVSLDGLEGED